MVTMAAILIIFFRKETSPILTLNMHIQNWFNRTGHSPWNRQKPISRWWPWRPYWKQNTPIYKHTQIWRHMGAIFCNCNWIIIFRGYITMLIGLFCVRLWAPVLSCPFSWHPLQSRWQYQGERLLGHDSTTRHTFVPQYICPANTNPKSAFVK
jgi:hypothetical protein